MVSPEAWSRAAQGIADLGGRLLSLWASRAPAGEHIVHAAFISRGENVRVFSLPLPAAQASYPGIEHLYYSAARMQRAAADLSSVFAAEGDPRPWLRHAAWPADFHPLIDAAPPPPAAAAIDDYAFVPVQGDGVHEIPVGPVHAGIIEPGHFRFSVVGEKVLRLEERLGYVHKGIERRFTELTLLEGHRLAARVSGDSAAAYSWAYCQALESMAEAPVPRAPCGSGLSPSSSSGWPTISVISARSATTRALPWASPSSPVSRSSCCARPLRRSDSAISWI